MKTILQINLNKKFRENNEALVLYFYDPEEVMRKESLIGYVRHPNLFNSLYMKLN